MAEARVETREVETVVKEQVEEVVLRMSMDEAEAVALLTGNATGPGKYRGAGNRVWNALDDAGVRQVPATALRQDPIFAGN